MQNAEIYGSAELDVRSLPSTQESADAILSNERAKAEFQTLFGVELKGNYAEQSEQIIKQLDYWWMANYKSQRQESAAQQVERWNAEHPQTVQDAANVQQNTENAANVQQNAENTQVNIDNAANSEYNETKTQESGGVSDVGNGVDSAVAGGVPGRQSSGGEREAARGFRRGNQVFPRRNVNGGDEFAGSELHGASGARVWGSSEGNNRRMSDGRSLGRGDILHLRERRSVTVSSGGVVTTEILSLQDSAAFSDFLNAARAEDKRNGWAVTPKTAEELADHEMIMTVDGSAGAAVASDGDIQAVFRNVKTGTKGSMEAIIPRALELGGTKLDCYGDGLVRVYERYGFTPVARVEFNEAYANDGWDASKGTPYIYFMIHNGDSAETVAANIGKYEHMSLEQLNALPTYGKEGYDEAAAYRDGLLQSRNGESVGAAKSGFDPYSHAANEYGAIEPGETPARVVDVPKSMDGSSRVSKVARTAMEAEATAETAVPKLEKAVVDGLFSYDPVTNEERRARSEKWFSQFDSTETALDSWRDEIARMRMTVDRYSNGIYLYAELNANAKGADNDTMREHYEQQAIGVLSTLQKTATESCVLIRQYFERNYESGNCKQDWTRKQATFNDSWVSSVFVRLRVEKCLFLAL